MNRGAARAALLACAGAALILGSPATAGAQAPLPNDTATPIPAGAPQRSVAGAKRASPSTDARVLRRGMSGEDVAALQDWLTRRGYPVRSTGYFGPVTEQRVKEFQTAVDEHRAGDAHYTGVLVPDGVVGRQTLAAFGLHEPLRDAGIRTVRGSPPWLAAIPGTGGLRVDARILHDVEALIVRYDLRVTAGYAKSGHALHGEHPLGLALDAVPADGHWERTARLSRDFGWRSACGSGGCVGRLDAPFRFVGYNGYPLHGDPAHAGRHAHIHLSWVHAQAPPNTRAAWVRRFRAP